VTIRTDQIRGDVMFRRKLAPGGEQPASNGKKRIENTHKNRASGLKKPKKKTRVLFFLYSNLAETNTSPKRNFHSVAHQPAYEVVDEYMRTKTVQSPSLMSTDELSL
jgi:hypothetical protein